MVVLRPRPGRPRPRARCRSGRNSCSGGSISRIVTGSPSIASRIPRKSSRCSGSSSASAASCRPRPRRRSGSPRAARRSPRNMCSVRHSPMPSAPNRRARAASSGVSALARTCSRRTPSACSISRATACTRSSSIVLALEVAHHHRVGDRRPRRANTSPVVPSIEMTSPSRIVVAAADRELASSSSVDVERLGAADAGAAHAAGHDGRVRGLAAAAGQDAPGGDHAVQVVGVGLLADQDHVLAALGPLDGGRRSRRPPCRRRRRGRRSCPWRAACARPSRRSAGTSAGRAGRRCTRRSGLVACRSGPRRPCARRSGTPPRAVRLPTRVCSIQSLPRSTVNSMSHMSR